MFSMASCAFGSTRALRARSFLFLELEVGVDDQITPHLHDAL